MLTAHDLQKSYGSLQVLKGVSLAINAQEVVAIVGASGAGKSTLLQLLGTLDVPDAGSVSLDGTDLFKLKAGAQAKLRNQHMGFIFQFHNLLPEFTALENVCIPGFIAGRPEAEVRAEARRLLGLLGLEARETHKPGEMSGGEQQRTAVARALINRPKVVLADEPSGNLDSANAAALHKLFFDLRSELKQTFVIVTHNESLATMADRKLVMRDGLIVE